MSISHLASLKQEARLSESRTSLNGLCIAGLNGICLGYAIDAARRVALCAKAGIPITLPTYPDDRIEHYEKLFLLAVFSALKSEDREIDWREIRPKWHPEVVNRIYREYERIAKDSVGAVVTTTREGKISNLVRAFDDLEREENGANHWIVALFDPHQELYSQHIVYVNPEQKVFADGESCFFWTDLGCSQFLEEVGSYLRSNYRLQFSNFRITCAKIDEVPDNFLFWEQVAANAATVAQAILYNPEVGFQVFKNLFFSPDAEKKSLETSFYSDLKDAVESNDLEKFVSLIEERGDRIPKGSCCYVFKNVEMRSDPIPFLNFLQNKGAPAFPVLKWLLFGLILYIKKNKPAFEEIKALLDAILANLSSLIDGGYDLEELRSGVMGFY